MGPGCAGVLGWLLLVQAALQAAGKCWRRVPEQRAAEVSGLGHQSRGFGVHGGLECGACPVSPAAGGRPCDAKDFGHGSLVCACSATYCDTLDPVVLPALGTFVKYESSKAGKRLERSEGSFQRNAKTPGTRRGQMLA